MSVRIHKAHIVLIGDFIYMKNHLTSLNNAVESNFSKSSNTFILPNNLLLYSVEVK